MKTTTNELNVDRLAKALSEILSRKHNAKITITFEKKENACAGLCEEVSKCRKAG